MKKKQRLLVHSICTSDERMDNFGCEKRDVQTQLNHIFMEEAKEKKRREKRKRMKTYYSTITKITGRNGNHHRPNDSQRTKENLSFCSSSTLYCLYLYGCNFNILILVFLNFGVMSMILQ